MKMLDHRWILLVAFCPAIALLSCSGPAPKTPEEAKTALFDQGIHFSTTTFLQSVNRGNLETVELFFLAGMDVDQRSEFGDTALMQAGFNPDPALARLVIAEGADVNAASNFGATALHVAAEQNRVELAEELLALHAEVDGVNSDGHTPLMLASRRGAAEIVAMLLDADARLDIRANGRNALQLASRHNHQEVVDLLTAATDERAARLAKDSPSEASGAAQGQAALPPEPTEEARELPEHDDHFTLVVYGIPENQPYDTRLFDLLVPVMSEAFPVADYADMGEVEELYQALKADPSRANGKELETVFSDFSETFSEADGERFQELYFELVSREMTGMQVRVARETLDAILVIFPLDSHPMLGDVVSAMEAYEQTGDDGELSKVEAAMSVFEATLTGEERSQIDSIRESTEKRLTAGDPEMMERQIIDGWIDDLERNRDWINSEPGAPVSPEAFGQLGENMDYAEVVGIVGREGTRTASINSSVNGAETTTTQYEWSWPLAPGTTARIDAWFLNGQLRVKSYNEVRS